ncbi:MAG: hypothetical protein AAB289_00180, partial [Chloroflexota bacterium]
MAPFRKAPEELSPLELRAIFEAVTAGSALRQVTGLLGARHRTTVARTYGVVERFMARKDAAELAYEEAEAIARQVGYSLTGTRVRGIALQYQIWKR